MSSEYDADNITECVIIPEEDGNVGDHLPLKIVFNVHIRKNNNCKATHPHNVLNVHPQPQWGDNNRRETYKSLLTESLLNIGPLVDQPSMGHDAQSIQLLIDSHIDKVNTAIHKATEDAGCIPNRRYKPEPFWCPELSAARDKKRFWWQRLTTIWRSF